MITNKNSAEGEIEILSECINCFTLSCYRLIRRASVIQSFEFLCDNVHIDCKTFLFTRICWEDAEFLSFTYFHFGSNINANSGWMKMLTKIHVFMGQLFFIMTTQYHSQRAYFLNVKKLLIAIFILFAFIMD